MIAPLANNPGPPRWIIDDTANLYDARLYVVHTQYPRIFGEILPPDDEDLDIVSPRIHLSNGDWLCYIHWIDPPSGSVEGMVRSLEEAIEFHWAIRDA